MGGRIILARSTALADEIFDGEFALADLRARLFELADERDLQFLRGELHRRSGRSGPCRVVYAADAAGAVQLIGYVFLPEPDLGRLAFEAARSGAGVAYRSAARV